MKSGIISVFLQIDAESLRLPAFDAASLKYLVYFLLFIIIGLVFFQWRLRRSHEKNALSNRFMQILMRRALTRTQQAAMQDFFDRLHEVEQNEIMISQKSLEHHLHQYLERHPEISAADRVEIFDKLLAGKAPQIEIKTVSDLRIGELCALDAGKTSWLTTIMKSKDDQILLTSYEKTPIPVGGGHVYAYRAGLGGFLLSGQIIKVKENSLIFKHNGHVDFRGDQHLMSTVSVAVKIERWPHPELGIDEEKPLESAGVEVFTGLSDKISDRALAVRFTPGPPDWILSRQDFWEMTLDLPEKPLICRVKATRYQKTDMHFLRPIDMDGAERNRLYTFIAAHNPVREHF